MRKKQTIRRCEHCDTSIAHQPSYHYLCYSCWREKQNYGLQFSNPVTTKMSSNRKYNLSGDSEYLSRYAGDSEYDYGPDWDYDEYPPENL